jgi:hypothetical protein
MKNVEVLRREMLDANIFALLAASDSARLMMAQGTWASKSDAPAAHRETVKAN